MQLVAVVTRVPGIAHAAAGIQRLDDTGCNPHWHTRLIMRGDARRFAIRSLVRPPKVEAVLPHGPPQRHPSYDAVFAAAHRPELADMTTVEWYSKARTEFSDFAQTDLSHRPIEYKWKRPQQP